MHRGFLLDVVVCQCAALHELPAGEDQALLVRLDARLGVDHCLDVLDGVAAFHLKRNRLGTTCVNVDLH